MIRLYLICWFESHHFKRLWLKVKYSLQGKRVCSIHLVRSGCIDSLDASVRRRRAGRKSILRSVTSGLSSKPLRDDGSNSTASRTVRDIIHTNHHCCYLGSSPIFFGLGFFFGDPKKLGCRGALSLDDRVFTLCALTPRIRCRILSFLFLSAVDGLDPSALAVLFSSPGFLSIY